MPNAFYKMETCISAVNNWLTTNQLKLHCDKTEFIVFRSHFSEVTLNFPPLCNKYANCKTDQRKLKPQSFWGLHRWTPSETLPLDPTRVPGLPAKAVQRFIHKYLPLQPNFRCPFPNEARGPTCTWN